VTYQRQNIFTDFILARIVVQAMRQQHQEQKVNSLAFVVMPDHFHFLLKDFRSITYKSSRLKAPPTLSLPQM
jgi:REP element-mobilizing transposase RayT